MIFSDENFLDTAAREYQLLASDLSLDDDDVAYWATLADSLADGANASEAV